MDVATGLSSGWFVRCIWSFAPIFAIYDQQADTFHSGIAGVVVMPLLCWSFTAPAEGVSLDR